MRCTAKTCLFALVLLASNAVPSAAQDVIKIARDHGTPVPTWIREALARDPNAFEVRNGWRPALARAKALRTALRETGFDSGSLPPRAAAAYGTAISGQFKIPVLAVKFADTKDEPFPASFLQSRLFGTPASGYSLTSYYTEVSRGLVQMTGTVSAWAPLQYKDEYYEAGDNGPAPYIGMLLREAVEYFDASVDFSQYDSDGDGVVDAVAFVHAETGGECGTTNIWSHRWTYEAASGGERLFTKDGVEIVDYSIQPAYNCFDGTPISIGVFAHETGHLWGLPDLYALSYANSGIGPWGLMGGGGQNTVDSPAHLSAWSKAELGWMPVSRISRDTTGVILGAAATTGEGIRLDIPGSPGEYFLLENRARLGSDQYLYASGLLVWHVDSAVIANNLRSNSVQNQARRKGVDLVEADGLRGLDTYPATGGYSGHPFPGSTYNYTFSTASNPASLSNAGLPTGIAIENIVQSGDSVSFNVRFEQAACAPGIVLIGQSLSGMLASTDCAVEGIFVDGWLLNLAATAELTIDLSSTAFDALLVLTDALGNTVQIDDNGAGGTNARIRRTLAAGQYVVWASTRTAGHTGAYTLTAQQTSTPTCSTGTIALGQSATGQLTTADCLVDGRFYDHRQLTLATQVQVGLELTSDDFDALLILEDSAGNLIATDDDGAGGLDSRIERTLEPGTYSIWVTSANAGGKGFYTLEALDVATSTCASSTIAAGGIRNGSLLPTDCQYNGGNADAWIIDVAADTTLQIDLTSNAFDAYLIFTDTAGNVQTYDDDAGTALNAMLDIDVKAGRWVIWATSYDSAATGAYTLEVRAAVACSSDTVAVAQTVSGALNTADCVRDGRYSDAWILDIAADTSLTVALNSGTFDSYLIITDAQGAKLAEDDDAGGNFNSRIVRAFTAGRYVLWATSYDRGAAGSYTLSATPVGETACSATNIALGQTGTGSLSTADCIESGRYFDAWVLDLTAETSVRIDLASNEFDTQLSIVDAAGTEIAFNDDADSTTTNSGLEKTLASGRYFLWVTSFQTGGTGAYQITVGEPGNGGDECLAPAFVPPDTIAGTLAVDGCTTGGFNYDPYLLEISAETRLRFELRSSEFDAYLLISDYPVTGFLAQTDGGGSGTDAVLEYSFAPGRYVVWASGGTDQTGAYTLSGIAAGSSGMMCHRRGDTNNDGAVDRHDVEAVLRSLARGDTLDVAARMRADVSGDGRVDLVDAHALAEHLQGTGNPQFRIGQGSCRTGGVE